jgi:hypothetical protein
MPGKDASPLYPEQPALLRAALPLYGVDILYHKRFFKA